MRYANGHSVLIRHDELAGWHPLDGVAAPQVVPSSWDGPHVGLRLADAFGILARLPMRRGPRFVSGLWPGFPVEFADRSGYEDQAWWKAERAEEQRQRKELPSAVEIAQMEAAISWPPRYVEYPQLLRVVGVIALWKSRDADIDFIAKRKLRLPPHVARRWNNEALSLIATGLRADKVRTF